MPKKKHKDLVNIPVDFPNVNQNIVLTELLRRGSEWSILYNLPRLTNVDVDATVRTIIEPGYTAYGCAMLVLGALVDPKNGLDPTKLKQTTLARLMELVPSHSTGSAVKEIVDKLPKLENALAFAIASKIDPELIADNLAKVEKPDSRLALSLAGGGMKAAQVLLDNIEMFDAPGAEAAYWLMRSFHMEKVFSNLSRFKGVNPNDVAQIALRNGADWYIFRDMKEIDLNEILPAMIMKGISIEKIAEVYSLSSVDSDKLFTFFATRSNSPMLMREFLAQESAKLPNDATLKIVIQNHAALNEKISEFNRLAPTVPLSQAFLVSLDFYADYDATLGVKTPFESALDEFKLAPRLAGNFILNPRYARRLFKALSYLDEPSKENVRLLHQSSLPKNSLTLFSDDVRKSQIDSQRDYKNNPQILSVLGAAGIPTEKWLGYGETESFVLQSGEELPLQTLKCSTPIDRVLATSIPEFHTRTLAFIRELPTELLDSPIPELEDEKLSALRQKKKVAELGLASAEENGDSKTSEKIPSIKKGLASIQSAIEQYRAPKVRDVFQGRIDASLVSKKDLDRKIAKRDALIEVHKAKPERKTLSQLKQLDKHIAEALVSLLDRTDEAILLISHVVSDKDMQANYSDAMAMLKDHLEEDRRAINEAFSENSESGSLNGREITIGVSDRNPYTALYIGNQTDCCVRIDSDDVHGDRSPISDYLTDLGMQIVVAADTTDPKKPIPVAAAWCYIGSDAGKPVLMIDNIEANTKYNTDAYKPQFEPAMKAYLESYAGTLGIPLFQGKLNNDLEVAPLKGVKKLGGYNRDSYYLEGEVADFDADGAPIMAI